MVLHKRWAWVWVGLLAVWLAGCSTSRPTVMTTEPTAPVTLPDPIKRPKLGLALGGGAARGPLAEHDVRVAGRPHQLDAETLHVVRGGEYVHDFDVAAVTTRSVVMNDPR